MCIWCVNVNTCSDSCICGCMCVCVLACGGLEAGTGNPLPLCFILFSETSSHSWTRVHQYHRSHWPASSRCLLTLPSGALLTGRPPWPISIYLPGFWGFELCSSCSYGKCLTAALSFQPQMSLTLILFHTTLWEMLKCLCANLNFYM